MAFNFFKKKPNKEPVPEPVPEIETTSFSVGILMNGRKESLSPRKQPVQIIHSVKR